MNRSIVRATQVILIVCVVVAGVFAQQRGVPAADKYKISASAGMINYSEGLTSVTHPDGTAGTLIIGDSLKAGDRVVTSEGGMAEVLLNPGSYLRLGGESEFSFRSTSLDDLRLDVHRGSAILEVFASNEFKVSAFTPKGRVTIVNTGVYRIDVGADGNGLVSVIEGKAVVGERNIALVKDGKTGTLSGGEVIIGKFDKGKRDGLAAWSRTRSKDLAKMSSAFNARNTKPLIVNSLIDSFSAGTWGRSGTRGVWGWDPSSRTCIFLPYYYNWSSPYGYGYNACMCNYYLPPTVRPKDLPVRLDGRKDDPWEISKGTGTTKTRDNNGKDVDFGPPPSKMKDSVVFSPPPPPQVFSPASKTKPIDN
ncbi:MAG: FecR domain-containing protein, partial [Pyrinomonadaceae bacterium]